MVPVSMLSDEARQTAAVNPADPHAPWRLPVWFILLALHVPLTTAMVVVILTESSTGITLPDLIRDPVQTLHGHAYVGYLSNLGAICWCGAAVSCLFASTALWRIDKANSRFLLFSGLINALLMCDDLFLIHDGAIGYRLGIGERRILACYALIMVIYLFRFRRNVLREPALFLIAMGFFSVSLAVDQSWSAKVSWRYFFEDGLKLLGIVTWLVLYVRLSLNAVRANFRLPSARLRSLG